MPAFYIQSKLSRLSISHTYSDDKSRKNILQSGYFLLFDQDFQDFRINRIADASNNPQPKSTSNHLFPNPRPLSNALLDLNFPDAVILPLTLPDRLQDWPHVQALTGLNVYVLGKKFCHVNSFDLFCRRKVTLK
ncbi:MAG: hypothetical protein LBK58_00225 [Prevotellaceae bacterium]|jgi:hypothetical protein|nr:hypothetical protein [Prevotellaceae bacterium]